MAAARQQELFRHGGKRPGAGRKRTLPGKPRVRHATREVTKPRFPVLVTKRICDDVGRLRRFELCAALRRAFVYGCRKRIDPRTITSGVVSWHRLGSVRGLDAETRDLRDIDTRELRDIDTRELRDIDTREFRICQFSIQGNHIHLLCEATDNDALARGIQAWSVRVARAVNRALGRRGKVFYDRYHMEVLRTPRQTRAALCYVLQNARRHHERIDMRFGGLDPFSSGWWFDGWRDDSWRAGVPPPAMRTVAEAKTWLLSVGWRRHGLLAIDEVPAAGRRV